MMAGKKRENIAFTKLEQFWKLLKLINSLHVEIQTIQKTTDKEKLSKNLKLKSQKKRKKLEAMTLISMI